MKVPFSWLKELCNAPLTVAQAAEKLALSGTEVERIVPFGVPREEGNLGKFVVGRVTRITPHPGADKLRICEVETGPGVAHSIVCGAHNFDAGATVAVSLEGAQLPGGLKIKAATIRGVPSQGMILSRAELGLEGESQGIWVLPDSLMPGEALASHLPIADDVLEIEVTPNRPDCLSMEGIARELHALSGTPLNLAQADEAPATEDEGSIDDVISIEVRAPDLCSRYAARAFSGITVASSPDWLAARLLASGMRPINTVVDITNYVMLLTGQPLHAFDLDHIAQQRIIVRRAQEEEPVTTLDGVQRRLTGDMLVIADGQKPSVVAGIMGSQSSEVRPDTRRVLLEAAHFDGPSILKTSKALGLRSESSNRFEKGLDPHGVPRALTLASHLLITLCGAKPYSGTLDVCSPLPEPVLVPLRFSQVERLLGTAPGEEELTEILTRLGFKVRRPRPGEWEVEVPSFRAAEVTRPADLIEEIARIWGLEHIPATLPRTPRTFGHVSAGQKKLRQVRERLVELGLSEVINYSFEAPSDPTLWGPSAKALSLKNPLSADMSVMRHTLLSGILASAQRNLRSQRRRVALFEIGRLYSQAPEEELPRERLHLSLIVVGGLSQPGWLGDPAAIKNPGQAFFLVKGLAQTLFDRLHLSFSVAPMREAFLRNGYTAQLLSGTVPVGVMGASSATLQESYDLGGPAGLLQIDLQQLMEMPEPKKAFEDVVTYPTSAQDLALVLDSAVPAGEVLETIYKAGGRLLSNAYIFDLYEGKQLPVGKKSLAVHLVFRAPNRTLKDKDIHSLRQRILSALKESCNASLR